MYLYLAYEFLIVNIFRNEYLILIDLLWNLTIFGVSQQRVLVQEEIVTSLELWPMSKKQQEIIRKSLEVTKRA